MTGHAPAPDPGSAVLAGDRGAAAVMLLLTAPVLFAFAGLVIDGGRAITARQAAADLAEQAARAGVDQLDVTAFRDTGEATVDVTRARTAACGYLTAAAPTAGCAVRATPTSVTVTVTLHTPTVLLGLVGIKESTSRGQATARPFTGTTRGQLP